MADDTFRTVLPALKAVDNGDGTFSVAVSIPGMPPLTGLTAGELLVATAATTAAWQNSGVILTAPDISGVVTAAAPLTMPAHSLGGTLDASNQILDNVQHINADGAVATADGFIRVPHGVQNILVARNSGGGANIALLDYGVSGNDVLTISPGTIQIHLNGITTLNAGMVLNGQVFDAGAVSATVTTTGGFQGLVVQSSHADASGSILDLYHNTGSPANADITGYLLFTGKDTGGSKNFWASIQCVIADVTEDAEHVGLNFYGTAAGGSNIGMTLSGAGALWVDQDIAFTTSLDSAAVADEVSLGGYEIGAGARALAISQEDPVIVEAVGASDRTLRARINGTTYKIMLHT